MEEFKEKVKKWLSIVLIILFLLSRYDLEDLPLVLLGIEVEEKQDDEQDKVQDEEEHFAHDCECDRVRKEDNEEEEESGCSHRGKKNLPRE